MARDAGLDTALHAQQLALLTVPLLWARVPTLRAVTSLLIRRTSGAHLLFCAAILNGAVPVFYVTRQGKLQNDSTVTQAM